MRKTVMAILISLATIGMIGCTPVKDISITQMTNDKVNLKAYKTYAPLFSTGILVDSRGTWHAQGMDVEAELAYLFKEKMSKKKKQQVVSNPDFYVVSVTGVDMDKVKAKVSRKDQVRLENIPEASLAIVFIDSHNGDIIWMSVAEGDLKSDLSLKKRKKRLNYTVKKMLKGL